LGVAAFKNCCPSTAVVGSDYTALEIWHDLHGSSGWAVVVESSPLPLSHKLNKNNYRKHGGRGCA